MGRGNRSRRAEPVRRRRRGFERAGGFPAAQLPLPAARARELQLARAWHEVAGPAVARRAPALALKRGVLEIRLPDGAWGRTLGEILPQLAARVARANPGLGITRLRLLPETAPAAAAPARPLPAVERAAPAPTDVPAEERPRGDEPSRRSREPASLAERLRRVADSRLQRP